MDKAYNNEAVQTGANQVRLRIHVADEVARDCFLDGVVFARKILNLVSALSAADVAVNGAKHHGFGVAKLQSSSPTITIEEYLSNSRPRLDSSSAVQALHECVNAAIEGNVGRARSFGKCAKHLHKLGEGAKRSFEYAELSIGASPPFRVDSFFAERALAVFSPLAETQVDGLKEDSLFSGVVFGSFDGIVQVADARGSMPAMKLSLTAGGQQIECICRADAVESIRRAFNRRVRVYGRAIYDGQSPFPRRVEVTDIEVLEPDIDISRWRGTFEPFDAYGWEDDV